MMLRAARRGVYISGPFFDDDDRARKQGLKFCWGNWVDHASRFGLARLVAILREQMNIAQYTVSLGFPALTPAHHNLLAIDERPNAHIYDASTCLPKWQGTLRRPLYQEFALSIARLPEEDTRRWHVARHGPASIAIAEVASEYARWPDETLAAALRTFTR
jgi:hypothetical protein